MRSMSTWALCTVAPGRRRPIIASVFPHRSVSSAIGKGRRKSTREAGTNVDEKSKLAGSTPTISVGSSFRTSLRPTTAGSPAKRRIQNPCVRRMAGRPPHTLSSSTKLRPSIGATPRTSRKSRATPTPTSRSGSPSPVRLKLSYSKKAK